jgi:hypothetical protein
MYIITHLYVLRDFWNFEIVKQFKFFFEFLKF